VTQESKLKHHAVEVMCRVKACRHFVHLYWSVHALPEIGPKHYHL